jgi:hypothetical protein
MTGRGWLLTGTVTSSFLDTGICPWPVEAVFLKQFPDKRIATWLSTFKKKLKS